MTVPTRHHIASQQAATRTTPISPHKQTTKFTPRTLDTEITTLKVTQHEIPPELPDSSRAGGRRICRNAEPAACDNLVPKVSSSIRR